MPCQPGNGLDLTIYIVSSLFPGWHDANEIAKLQVSIISNNSSIYYKNNLKLKLATGRKKTSTFPPPK